MEGLKDESMGGEGGLWFKAPLKMEFVATVALPDLYMGEWGCIVLLVANIRQYLVVSYILCLRLRERERETGQWVFIFTKEVRQLL